jgi:hypothetical protein
MSPPVPSFHPNEEDNPKREKGSFRTGGFGMKPKQRSYERQNTINRMPRSASCCNPTVAIDFCISAWPVCLPLSFRRDLALLHSSNPKDKYRISLAAKWAPSPNESHDKHTFVVSSIAEIMFTHEQVCPSSVPRTDRTAYLKHARAAYRFKVLSPLRRAIDIVEKHISENNFAAIKYEKVPSLAMSRYQNLFLEKDAVHFDEYLDAVSLGDKSISGAVLLPSVLVSKIRAGGAKSSTPKQKAAHRVSDLQWKTLVQRVRDSGKLESSIAICDVSGSMTVPVFADRTFPMDSSIGLSLLLADVCDGPFGGTIITFSETPYVLKVGGATDPSSLAQKVQAVLSGACGLNTNFVAVFRDMILPIAKKHNLKQEDMVKQVFVFSDMQFDEAEVDAEEKWTTSFDRIKKAYEDEGYEMPTMIFWNLAAGSRGVPVTATKPGTALVSGYSQGAMKAFLDGAGFGEEEEHVKVEEQVEEEETGDGILVDVVKEKKKRLDPLFMVKKSISHEAYSMLHVVD